MVTIDLAKCNGCGICVDGCPTGALVLQNNHAFIHQELCQDCRNCIDACPQDAILAGEKYPAFDEGIRIPANPALALNKLAEPAERIPRREMLLPEIGSVLLWMGRELVPRLADLALAALDRRIQTAYLVSDNQYLRLKNNDRSTSTCTREHRHRRRRRAMKKRM